LVKVIAPIKYEVNIDIHIIKLLHEADLYTLSLSELRRNVAATDQVLNEHLDQLSTWNIIYDEKPKGNGKARKISLTLNYFEATEILVAIKNSIETINKYFTI